MLFLGDFLCDGLLDSSEKLTAFLNQFSPPLGAYAVLGNHDYDEPVSINAAGDYDVAARIHTLTRRFKGCLRPLTSAGKCLIGPKGLKTIRTWPTF